MDNTEVTLDLSGKKLKKLNKPQANETQVTTLILDDNELQRLDNVDSYIKVQKLSAVRNQLLRMHQVCRLHSLHTLNLVDNGILTIEGLKDLIHLRILNLARNDIKTIEHLNTNINLEHLDLSENNISHITDLSFLKSLKELLLHNNKIGHLRQCEKFLPTSLITLTLAFNNISDLNEISQLVNLTNLHSISLANNPCVNITGDKVGFDYRPFIINWCMNVQVIDGYVVDAIESLRGEWLYSQGRGRHFRVGEQQELTQYLASVCPLTGEQLETEEDRKLRLILSKAQHHQQQLREQSDTTPVPSPITRKKFHHTPKYSPRIAKKNAKPRSPDRMSSSYYGGPTCAPPETPPAIMTQSLDPGLLGETISLAVPRCNGINRDHHQHTQQHRHGNDGEKRPDDEPEVVNSPLQALSKLVPVPESLMSPDYKQPPPSIASRVSQAAPATPHAAAKPSRAAVSTPPITRSPKAAARGNSARTKAAGENSRGSPAPKQKKAAPSNDHRTLENVRSSLKKSLSSEDDSDAYDVRLHSIQMRAEEKKQKVEQPPSIPPQGQGNDDRAAKAAVCIQRMWRGYRARNCDEDVQNVYRAIQAKRVDDSIRKLSVDMESTKAALESDRKIQILQMQAINALWKKVSTIHSDVDNSNAASTSNGIDNVELVKDLAQTCSVLQNQIQQLQGSMQDIVKFMTMFSQMPNVSQQLKETAAATQTEIVAVHTPQGDGAKLFPFHKQPRPSSLPLPVTIKSNKRDVNPELKQFAGTLVDDVIRTVSESNEFVHETRITVTDTGKTDKALAEDRLDVLDNSAV